MNHTFFNTPIISTLSQWFAGMFLRLAGWKLTGDPPDLKKYVLICGPHTSNWDFPLLLLVMLEFRVPVQWMGKSTLFPWGLGWFMKWLGGIPVNRKKSTNLSQQVVKAFEAADELVVVIAPEGTRGKVGKFKTGFYHIAHGANVPIALGYCDYANKKAGFGPLVYPNGDIDNQLPEIQAFFKGIQGKRPELGT